jgi:hypothetical protein
MKLSSALGWSSALCLGALSLQAQETNEAEAIRRQLREANEAFQKAMENYRSATESLNKRLEAVEKKQGIVVTSAPPALVVEGTSPAPASLMPKPWSPTDPIRLGTPQSYLGISFDALVAAGYSTAKDIETLQPGGHDPKQRGFTVQNLELTLDGKVDPYFRGQANIILQIDPEGETAIEVEEAFLETIALPWNLQAKAGHYFTEFGRLNPMHPHTWDFVDQPLVNGRFLGADGLRNPGARLSWLAPTPFYSEFLLGVQNSQGETAFSFRDSHEDELVFGRPAVETRVKSFGDLIFAPRYAASFELAEAHTVLLGASAALGPNATGRDTDTQIYGLDLFYKWKPRTHSKGFPFVTWQTEWMYRRYEAAAYAGDADNPALPSETLRDWGIYSQLSYGFRPGWVASLRGDYVTGDEAAFEPDPDRDTRWRLSPALTFYPSEFSKICLQYNYDDRENIGVDHSIWVQFEFLLGRHASHKF